MKTARCFGRFVAGAFSILLLCQGAAAQPEPPADLSLVGLEATVAAPLTAAALRAELLYAMPLEVETQAAPFILYHSPTPPLLDSPDGSPIDTLHMSPLERVFWGRHGFFRGTGLFQTDPENPTNDLRHLARLRRRMLSFHQALGLATVASMTVTVIGGQRAIEGKGSKLHTVSLPFTIGLYATSATLALTAPPKLVPARGGIDSITFHKIFAALHLAGMIVTPLLAPELGEGGGEGNASLHQALGYATYGAFTAGMITVTFLR